MDLQQLIAWAFQLSIGALVFAVGLGTATEDVRQLLRRLSRFRSRRRRPSTRISGWRPCGTCCSATSSACRTRSGGNGHEPTDAEAAAIILHARAVDDLRAGRTAPY
jgi:hypothetical protein